MGALRASSSVETFEVSSERSEEDMARVVGRSCENYVSVEVRKIVKLQ